MKNDKIGNVAILLAAIGAVNWGLVGILNFNLVSWLSGLVFFPLLEKIVYILVGVSGVWVIVQKILKCDSCK